MNTYFKLAGIASLMISAVTGIPNTVDASTVKPIEPTISCYSNLSKQSLVLQDYTPQCSGQQCSGPADSRGSGTR